MVQPQGLVELFHKPKFTRNRSPDLVSNGNRFRREARRRWSEPPQVLVDAPLALELADAEQAVKAGAEELGLGQSGRSVGIGELLRSATGIPPRPEGRKHAFDLGAVH